jgi:hypothetical protein
MARSASLGVERSTKAYPTGRSVRGFFGIEVDSLRRILSAAEMISKFQSQILKSNRTPA